MKPQIIKQFLNEAVIDSKKILDKAYELLSGELSSDEIEKKVKKILKKSKTEKEAIAKVEKLAGKEKDYRRKDMKFKEAVRYYLGTSNINEMALKHLEGTEDLWDTGDLDGVADKYIENIMADGKNYSNILRGLTQTFGSKRFADRKEDAEKVKELVRDKVRAAQKAEKDKE